MIKRQFLSLLRRQLNVLKKFKQSRFLFLKKVLLEKSMKVPRKPIGKQA